MHLRGIDASLDPPILPPIGEEERAGLPREERSDRGGALVQLVPIPGGQITAHFSWREAVGTTATVPEQVSTSIKLMALALEALRASVGAPLNVASWYDATNQHGEEISHRTGLGVDVYSGKVEPAELARKAWLMGFAVVARLSDDKTVHLVVPPEGMTLLQGALVQLDAAGKVVATVAASTGRAVTARTPIEVDSRGRTTALNERGWTQEQKLASLEPTFRRGVAAVLAGLRAQGFDPFVASAWRSIATQARLKAEGKSQVNFSFHNALLPDGKPGALAIDLADRRYSWGTVINASGKEVVDLDKQRKAAGFFRAMGALAMAQGLHWGGSTASGFSQRGAWKAHGMSWDPAHLQQYHSRDLGKIRAASMKAMRVT